MTTKKSNDITQGRRKKNKGNDITQGRRKKNKGNLKKPCAHTHGHFCQSRKNSSPLNFLFILRRKYFGGSGKKTPRPHHLFSFLPTQPSTLPNKHTLSSYHEFGNVICFLNRFIFFVIPIVHPQCTWFDNLSIVNNILMLFNKKKKIYFLTHKKYEVYV